MKYADDFSIHIAGVGLIAFCTYTEIYILIDHDEQFLLVEC